MSRGKQMYYEQCRGELLKVHCVREEDGEPHKYRMRVMETRYGYYEGESILAQRMHVVVKTGRVNSGGHIMVHEVQPDELKVQS